MDAAFVNSSGVGGRCEILKPFVEVCGGVLGLHLLILDASCFW